nr:MAG TPA: hypothetical protein [Caudoviricetes sp.]
MDCRHTSTKFLSLSFSSTLQQWLLYNLYQYELYTIQVDTSF